MDGGGHTFSKVLLRTKGFHDFREAIDLFLVEIPLRWCGKTEVQRLEDEWESRTCGTMRAFRYGTQAENRHGREK